jgi:cysteine-rich repeat protein
MARTRSGLRIAALAALTIVGTAVLAPAADAPLPGKLLLVKDTKIAKVIAKSTGTPFPVPAAGGPTDPTANASSIVIDDLGGGGELTEVDLATGNWKGLGNPAGSKGWAYTNRSAAAGADPVKKIIIKSQLVKVIARDDGTLDGPAAGAVEMFLTLGTDTYCARFGGTNIKNTTGLVKRKDAPAPADCSVPPAPVCGNGVAEAPSEECDDGGTSPGDGCSATCQLESVNPALCAGVPTTSGTTLAMTLVADGLTSPVHVAAPRLDTNRLFIVEQSGLIRVVRNGVLSGTPYLDIESLVAYSSGGTEQGLLSVAFDPDFETNGRFYVYYVNNSGNVVIARYTANGDPSSSDDADESSAVVMTTVPHPGASNHNGGQLQIGPDGFLYAAIGDGGGGCDSTGPNAQLDTDARGKLLRIDRGATFPVDPVDAIWQKGLRNPFRFSFDRGTGDLYIGDVGQNAYEEIDVDASPVSSGVNWGWLPYEGNHCSNEDPMVGGSGCGGTCPPPAGFTFPVLEYTHGDGCSVSGGYVYRGCALPDLLGTYFYSDFCSSFVRTFNGVSGGVAQNQADRTADVDPDGDLNGVSGFGEDARGEIYIVSHGNFAAGAGAVYRIEAE